MPNVVEVVFRGTDEITKSVEGMNRSVEGFIGTMRHLAEAFVASEFVKAADEMIEYDKIIKTATGSTEQFTRVQRELVDIALDTNQSYTHTVEIFGRIVQATQSISVSEKQRLDIVKAINAAQELAGPLAGDVANQ